MKHHTASIVLLLSIGMVACTAPASEAEQDMIEVQAIYNSSQPIAIVPFVVVDQGTHYDILTRDSGTYSTVEPSVVRILDRNSDMRLKTCVMANKRLITSLC